jgi:hypothetical protein
MRQSVKSLLTVLVIFSAGACVFAWIFWFDGTKNLTNDILRFGMIPICLLFAFLALKMAFTKDIAPDYLGMHGNPYLNKNGFCFDFHMKDIDGIAHLVMTFQNQFERKCRVDVAIKPQNNSFDDEGMEITCPGGAYGMAAIPIAIPYSKQGLRLNFKVGATVHYPEGKGKRLRFKDGILVRYDSNFYNTFGTFLSIFGIFALTFLWQTPASIYLRIPYDVDSRIRKRSDPVIAIFWQPGDRILSEDEVENLDIDGLL